MVKPADAGQRDDLARCRRRPLVQTPNGLLELPSRGFWKALGKIATVADRRKGFENAVAEVVRLATTLGIGDLAGFTAP